MGLSTMRLEYSVELGDLLYLQAHPQRHKLKHLRLGRGSVGEPGDAVKLVLKRNGEVATRAVAPDLQ